MIAITFPSAADSPTGQAVVRVRYSITRRAGQPVPVLKFAHGSRELNADTWHGFRSAGATLSATDDRSRQVACEALGLKWEEVGHGSD